MQTQSINQHYTEDHQHLDDLFHEFQSLKSTDCRSAEKVFSEFKTGLERHIVWEEEILFPAFETKLGHLQNGPTAVMRLEHREIRKYLDSIARKLADENFETDEEEMGLETVLCPHNHKEEGILYPMMDQIFSEPERTEMFSEMNKSKGTLPVGRVESRNRGVSKIERQNMKVAVYDTHVMKKDGGTIHFDVIVPQGESHDRVLDFGREHLKTVGQEGQNLTAKECEFCHVEPASEEIEQAINQRGYYVKELIH